MFRNFYVVRINSTTGGITKAHFSSQIPKIRSRYVDVHKNDYDDMKYRHDSIVNVQ